MEIGGYFELESNLSGEFHTNALKLNSGRNCLRYILNTEKPSKVFIPRYCCTSVLTPFLDKGYAFEYYNINERFEINKLPSLKKGQLLVYVNYFGLKTDYASYLANVLGSNLILDYTQAFFFRPINGTVTFYSPRKFFGVPDGGYLYTKRGTIGSLKFDKSLDRFNHLVGRLDKSATAYYDDFNKSSAMLSSDSVKQMSKVTQHILNGIDYNRAKLIRERNFYYLHSQLQKTNLISINFDVISGPMIYPYLTDDPNLRKRLINSKIYIATYWPELKKRVEINMDEKRLIEYLLPLPIDQRYKIIDMKRIVDIING